MRLFSRLIPLFMAVVLAVSGLLQLPNAANAATATDYVSVTKTVSPSSITTKEEAEVTLSIQGTPPVNVVKPNDVILIIDRSGSMAQENKMASAREGAKGFIDLMDLTKHRVGIVDFSSDSKSFPLTTDATAAKNYIDTLTQGGSTATGDAISKAIELLAGHRPEAQPVIVILTDGDATVGQPSPYEYALQKANEAKDAGIVFYTIALLLSTDNADTSGPNKLLKDMATTAHHHHFVLGSVGLADIYNAIVKEIGMASAYDVVVTDTVTNDFDIVPGSYDNNIPKPVVNGNTLTWNFVELKTDVLTFKYKIKPRSPNKKGNLLISAYTSNIVYKDYTGAARTKVIPVPYVTVTYPTPIISSLVQDSGNIKGGETVIINGDNFRPNPTVYFGTKQATNVQYIDSTKLSVTAPSGTQGTVVVTLTNDDLQSAQSSYRYKANPTVTSITPNIGPLPGGNQVVITGQYFTEGAKVEFGNVVASSVSSNTTTLTVTAPAGASAGPVEVKVTNLDGTNVVVPNGYLYLDAPTITSLTPNSGVTTGGQAITITGTNFVNGTKVYFGTKEAQTTFVSTTQLAATTPAWAKAESVDIKVVNPDNQLSVLTQGYTYINPDPTITSISPNNGSVTGGTIATITGTGFLSGAKVFFDETELTAVTFLTDTSIRVKTPVWLTAEAVDVKVVNPDTKSAISADAFTYNPLPAPTLTSIAPVNGPLAGGTSVTISGANFVSGTKIYLDAQEITGVTFLSATQLKFTTPAWSTAEAVDIKVVNPDAQSALLADSFTFLAPQPKPAPTVENVTGNNGDLAGGLIVTINGQNYVSGAKVFFDSTELATTFMSANQLKVKTPAWTTAGAITVKVVNPDNQEGALSAAFTYIAPPPPPAPVVDSVSPNSGDLTGGIYIFINGQNYVSGAKVFFDSIEVPATFFNSTQLKLKTPVWTTPGAVTVKVVNPDGQESTLAGGFTYLAPPPPPAPVISNISPNNGLLAGGIFILVNGQNFVSGAKVYFNNVEVPGTFMSSNQIKIKSPAWAVAESVNVTVTNPDNQTVTLPGGFTYTLPPGPTVTSLSPNSGPQAGGTLLVINGANFTTTSRAFFKTTELPVTYLNGTQLRVKTPAWPSGETVDIKVLNPDGQNSTLVGGYTFISPPPAPAPTITSVSPNSGVKAGGNLITVNGTNFVSGAQVYINNVSAGTTFYGTTQLRVRVPASATIGAVDVKVVNPDGQTVSLTAGYTYN
ncbi:IPT/TIG domain-containing protein [Paenibacillus aceris]|uniref:Uncharacterized protein YegL n=1 Tax=Paenibacillus aceris TaxID=869555 RepID=A0ABS4I4G9_9BACL|nr:IPT/TIG domain-containing protein [Paenibacillus aceris]MBP1965808.1 uncharacterized protein YegL [Paenibacillus aceris]NHW34846.1 VWA domain-containing protein [Paenibacillus aceris]